MPTYNKKPMPYGRYERSKAPTAFEEYESCCMGICWIDLLGVGCMDHSQILKCVNIVLDCAAQSSSTGGIWSDDVMVGTTNKAVQYALIGDALIIVEKLMPQTPAVATLNLIYRVNLLARMLNEKGLLFRGVLTRGAAKCFKHEGSTMITGEGVVKAATIERGLKTSGLFYDEQMARFINSPRSNQVEQHSYWVDFTQIPDWDAASYAKDLSGVCFSQYEGWEKWNEVIGESDHRFDKVINAQSLIAEIKVKCGLP